MKEVIKALNGCVEEYNSTGKFILHKKIEDTKEGFSGVKRYIWTLYFNKEGKNHKVIKCAVNTLASNDNETNEKKMKEFFLEELFNFIGHKKLEDYINGKYFNLPTL